MNKMISRKEEVKTTVADWTKDADGHVDYRSRQGIIRENFTCKISRDEYFKKYAGLTRVYRKGLSLTLPEPRKRDTEATHLRRY
jgi:hypothetical protein